MNALVETKSAQKQYIVGFVSSIILTIVAFGLVTQKPFENKITIALILFLAIVQLYVQLVYFLHLNREKNPRWNLMLFILSVWFLIWIVLGSLWIMKNLDYNMSQQEYEQEILIDEGYLKE
jgi:cytochrome o ubiquinol oxidase operon protein cyoD